MVLVEAIFQSSRNSVIGASQLASTIKKKTCYSSTLCPFEILSADLGSEHPSRKESLTNRLLMQDKPLSNFFCKTYEIHVQILENVILFQYNKESYFRNSFVSECKSVCNHMLMGVIGGCGVVVIERFLSVPVPPYRSIQNDYRQTRVLRAMNSNYRYRIVMPGE